MKWIFRNEMNEQGKVVRNRARLVCKGHSQEKGIDYEETYEPIARMDSIRLFLSYVVSKNFKVYQMDVNSSFLNGELEEEFYIEFLDGLPLTKEKVMVCRLKKDLYGLKKAPRTQYERLDKYLTKIGFTKGVVGGNFYLRKVDNGLSIIAIF